jgi:hypothetical protein
LKQMYVAMFLAGVIATAGIEHLIPSARAAEASAPRWEYEVVSIFAVDDIQPALNKLGLDGWELVADYASRYTLKRRRAN